MALPTKCMSFEIAVIQKVIMAEIPNAEITLWGDHFSAGRLPAFPVEFVFFILAFFVLIFNAYFKAKSQTRKI